MTDAEREGRFEEIIGTIRKSLLIQARDLRALDELDEITITLLARVLAERQFLESYIRCGHRLSPRQEEHYRQLYEKRDACLNLLEFEFKTIVH